MVLGVVGQVKARAKISRDQDKMLPAPSERLADALARLETLRVVSHEKIETAPMSEASRANARGGVERSYHYAVRLCPQISAMFGNGGSEARH